MATYTPGVQVGKNRHDNRSSFIAIAQTTIGCLLCNDVGHAINCCSLFRELTPSYQLKKGKRLPLCMNFLKGAHQLRHCNSSHCRTCGSKHHTLMHFENTIFSSEQTPLIHSRLSLITDVTAFITQPVDLL